MLGNKKKIYIIGTVGVPACYGGFESLVDNLLDYTPDDVEYTVFCTAKKYTVVSPFRYPKPSVSNAAGSSASAGFSAAAAARPVR